MEESPIVPGRGLNIPSAIESRLNYMNSQGFDFDQLANHQINVDDVKNNIESFMGSVELPVGLVGPILFNHNGKKEFVHCVAATLEGALIASMNRGARAIGESGGFNAQVLHQKMVRSPMFIFNNIDDAFSFKEWIDTKFNFIKDTAEQFSNHAKLLAINTIIIGRTAHTKFVYKTGDASGQNMTTTCTWHAMLRIVDHIKKETAIEIQNYVIEGNGASDKKASVYSMLEGRGIHVTAECFLREDIIQRILRTSSENILSFYNSSMAMAGLDGMHGYNINVANAIASIFAATGQDLGSIHESSTGILNIEKTNDGLYVSLNLPSLVVGTVGGGTHLPKQKQALELMNCHGTGKIERFACLIAGFAMGLELSTYSAIVSGAFAKAHEKLGRNRPVDWLLKSEINKNFVENILDVQELKKNIAKITVENSALVDNGIITGITNRVSKKLIGFIPVNMTFKEESGIKGKELLIKSKALDIEVVKGLHLMASFIDTELSDLLFESREELEYWYCHEKEPALYKILHDINFEHIPKFYGSFTDIQREIYIILMERLNNNELLLINSQKNPEKWTIELIRNCIESITIVHRKFEYKNDLPIFFKLFEPWKSPKLYKKLLSIMCRETVDEKVCSKLQELQDEIEGLGDYRKKLKIPTTLIHHDFNPRNIAIRKDGTPCIYDWELAVLDFPHRDIVEFLSFVLPIDFDNHVFIELLRFHHSMYDSIKIKEQEWFDGYICAIKTYIITRVSFYEVAGIQAKYAFSNRILSNSLRMLGILESKHFLAQQK